MVRNVHVRELGVPADEVGPLLDAMGGPDDVLWPAPQWPPMRLDQPLRVGSAGGHGPIRYHVSGYEPGRRLECTLDPGRGWEGAQPGSGGTPPGPNGAHPGLHGTHTFTVEPLGPDRCRLRHEIDGRVTGAARVLWPVAIRWLHDAVLEDLFDRAERALGTGPARPARWSPWVWLLRHVEHRPRAAAVPLPPSGLLDVTGSDAADAFAVPRPQGTSPDPQWWADALFRDVPPAVAVLMAVREMLVGLVGIERARGDEFDTRERTDDEVLLAADAGHLAFRCVVRVEPRRVVVATAVDLHDARGRLYWGVVRQVHPHVVRAMLARAARRACDRAVPPARTGAAVT